MRLFVLFSVLALLSLPCFAETQKKCRALVLQGGGDKGAYQAGVLYGLITNTENPEDFEYDVVTGVSVGAINGLCVAQYPKGQELAAVNDLKSFWTDVRQQQIFVPWKGGIIEGLFFRPSLYNSDPEKTYLMERVKGTPNKRKATIVSTDVNTGERITFDEHYWGDDNEKALDAVMYSTAVPFIFKYRNVGERTFIDGGWSGEGLDIEDAIHRCKEVVKDDKDIIVDVIFAGNFSDINVKAEGYTSLKVLARYFNIKNYVSATKAYTLARTFYPDVDFRYVMVASKKLPNQDIPLDFKPENLQFMIDLGIEDAKNALKEGPGKGPERLKRIGRHF